MRSRAWSVPARRNSSYEAGDPVLARLRTWNLRHSATGTHTAAVPIDTTTSKAATTASGLCALLPATPASTIPVRNAAPALMFPHPGQLSGGRAALRARRSAASCRAASRRASVCSMRALRA
jgi:hypothetical protein